MRKYILNNLKHSITKQRLMMCLLVIVQLFSVIVITFSYGIVNHYNFKIDEKESTTLIYNFLGINYEGTTEEEIYRFVDKESVDGFLREVLPYIEKKLDYFYISGPADKYMIECSSGYEKGVLKLSTQLNDRTGVIEGEMLTDEQMNSSEKIMVAQQSAVDSNWCIQIDGETYRAVGLLSKMYAERSIFVPYKAIPKNTKFYFVSFILTEPLLESEYNEIVSMVKDAFGDTLNIPEFEGIVNESSNRVYKDIMFVTAFLIIVCAVNYCIMYRYMLDKKRREFAISRICGCSKYKAGIVYMIELIGVSAITLGVGLLMYHHFILPKAVEKFNYIGLFYGKNVYMAIGGVYMGILSIAYIVLVCRFIRKTPAALVREV